MHPRQFALYGGILMLIIGVASLVPGWVGPVAGLPALQVETSYGFFLNTFPMNILNKVTLILFGIAGIAVANSKFRSLPLSITYARVVFVVMGLAAVLGLFPQTNTLNGYWPLFGNETWAHGVFAIFGAYFGFALSSRVPRVEDREEVRREQNLRTPLHGQR